MLAMRKSPVAAIETESSNSSNTNGPIVSGALSSISPTSVKSATKVRHMALLHQLCLLVLLREGLAGEEAGVVGRHRDTRLARPVSRSQVLSRRGRIVNHALAHRVLATFRGSRRGC